MALQVVIVYFTKKRLVRQLYRCLYEAAGGLVLQEDQEWTAGKEQQQQQQNRLIKMSAFFRVSLSE